MASEEGPPPLNIGKSRHGNAMRRQKSMASGLRMGGSYRAREPSFSFASFGKRFMEVMNAPIHPNYHHREPSDGVDKSSGSSEIQRSESNTTTDDEVPPPVPSKDNDQLLLHITTENVVRSYQTYRKSIMSGTIPDDDPVDPEILLADAALYRESVQALLNALNQLPQQIRDSAEVRQMMHRVESHLDLLSISSDNPAMLNILDNTIMLTQALIEDVRDLLSAHRQSLDGVEPFSKERQEADSPIDISASPVEEEDIKIENENGEEITVEGEEATTEESNENPYEIPLAAIRLSSPIQLDFYEPACAPRMRRARSSAALLQKFNSSKPHEDEHNSSRESLASDVDSPIIPRSPYNEPVASYSRELHDIDHSLNALSGIIPIIISDELLETSRRGTDDRDVEIANGKTVRMSSRAIVRKMLMEALYPNTKTTEALMDVIFTSFHAFWSPGELANLFIETYNCATNAMDKSSTILLCEIWLREYWTRKDRDCEDNAIQPMRKLLGQALADESFEGGSERVMSMLNLLKDYATGAREQAVPPIKHIKKSKTLSFRFGDVTRDFQMTFLESSGVKLRDFFDDDSIRDFAEQLTLKESAIYLNIQPADIVMHCIKPGEDIDVERKLAAHERFSSMVFRWTKHSVLKRSTAIKRAQVYKFMIKLAWACYHMHNYNSAFSIYSGLSSIILDNLPLTSSAIKPRTKAMLWELENVLVKTRVDQDGRRESPSFRPVARPTVPIIGQYVGALKRVVESSPVVKKSPVDDETDLIKLALFWETKRITNAMRSNQVHPYNFSESPHFQEYLKQELSEYKVPDDETVHSRYLCLKAFENSHA